jgi:hypothetical protein
MSNNTIRIRTSPLGDDKYLKVNIEQEFDFLEVLSLKLSQEDVYREFCSDYGVIAGRVTINRGFGIPNARVSIFIPIDDEDKLDPVKKGIYPYENLNDKDSNNIRYNVLPKESESENACFTPVGTFPTKREVLDNDTIMEVYEKYYKFSTTTNYAGDFLLFGVPLGTHTLHVDADISDIGIASQRPYDAISQGAPVAKYETTTKFLPGKNLDKLPQIKSANVGVNVEPFWGDVNSCEIGINRIDLDLNYDIIPCAIFTGGIFGDHGKNSINKRCRPRKKLGVLNEQITNEGTIRMIRKTLNDEIEEFNVDGGELIDEFGAWAYQIPLNLDYMVTSEYGDMVLSEDDNKGIPTRSRVRFNIGMNDDGSNGRLRTRARYLVPNNPPAAQYTDYEFGKKTLDESFRDIYWNKIYTVSNFIPRFQRNNSFTPNLTRNATAIKDVEDAGGNKVLFPYNRVTTEFNPLFFIFCLILTIIVLIVKLINATIIFLLNLLIELLNRARKIRIPSPVSVSITLWRRINYIPCIKLPCDEKFFAPGCSRGGLQAAQPVYSTEGFLECILFQIAKALNLFQFDFYNDWINGSLYAYLLKYKRRRKKERFCEVNCNDLAAGGVDGNGNGVPDNACYDSLLSDTCFRQSCPSSIGGRDNCQKSFRPVGLREGLIKKVGKDFFYGANNKSTGYKMFATELIHLGSVFDCDWQGIPKLQQYLITSTYKIPPDTVELTDDGQTTELAGQCDIEGNTCGVYFTIDCAGLHTNARQCLNVRHQCEFGVDLHGLVLDTQNKVLRNGDYCTLTKKWEIDDNTGIWFRDVFWYLNQTTPAPWVGPNSFSGFYTLPNTPDTSFNINGNGSSNYDFISTAENGLEYHKFRGYGLNHGPLQPNDDSGFSQPEHSYFFYFGLVPGNSGLDRMNKKFFAPCTKKVRDSILINSSSTSTSTNTSSDGTITFSIIGGIGPYTYTITSVNNPNGIPFNIIPITGSIPTSNTPVTEPLTGGLVAGTYNISVVDAIGTPVSDLVTINGPQPLYCIAYVSSGATSGTTGFQNGAITISDTGGGVSPYGYVVTTSTGAIVQQASNFTAPVNISLPVSDSIGYVVDIFDSSVPASHCIKSGLTITGPSQINVSYTATNEHCWGSEEGALDINITGGKIPYEVTIIGNNDFELNNQLHYTGFTSIPGGVNGPFTVTVVDDIGTTVSLTVPAIGFDIGQMLMFPSPNVGNQCDPNNYQIPFFISSANNAPAIIGQPVYVQYAIDANSWVNYPPIIYSGAAIPMYLTIPASTTVGFPFFTPINTINTRIAIRYMSGPTYPAPPCYSEEIVYEASQLTLPPVKLQITGDTDNVLAGIPASFNNAIQPSITIGQYKFDTTYNLFNFNRAPYTLRYKVDNGSLQTITPIYNMPYTLYIPNLSPGQHPLEITIYDSKGCVSQTITPIITLPSAVLVAQCVTNLLPPVVGSPTQYSHKVTATGGQPPYYLGTPTGINIPTGPVGYTYQDGASILIGVSVYDSTGNSVVIVNV